MLQVRFLSPLRALLLDKSTVDGMCPEISVLCGYRLGALSGRGRWLTRLLWEQDTPSSILGPRTVQHQARQAQRDERPVEAREVLRSIRRTGAHSTCGRSTTEVRCLATAETRVRLPATARMYLLR